jgi:hypothetical protein
MTSLTSSNQTNRGTWDCYIKKIYSEDFVTIKIPLDLTVSEFIGTIKFYTSRTIFQDQINNGQIQMSEIEVIEAGQPNAEEASALLEEDFTMLEKYGDKLKYTAFYVRNSNLL